MNLNKVDLNLFIVFDAIYTEANLTRAGQIVGITQPAVSNALARLRETFNDPLFVRTAQGMVPTPMAQNIIGPVRNALQLLRVSVQESRTFSPAQANKTFRISMTDLTEAVMLPPLFQRLRRLAPNVKIESMLAKRRETTKELAAGRLDFAMDAPLNTDPQVRHVKLLEDRYICAMRRGHPLAKDKLTERLDPLGFNSDHVDKLTEVLDWVKEGADTPPIPLPPDAAEAPDSDEEEGAVLNGESLHWSAIIGEHAKLTRLLAKPGIQVNGVDERGYTAFHQACGNGHVDCVRVLLDAQCDTTCRNAVRLTGW